jgi:beta-lactamase regulating signal transducer with metallopeptidase domain
MHNITQLLSPQLGQAIGWTLLHSLWQAMLIALAAAVLMVVFRQKKAQVRYRVAGLGLGLTLLSAVVTFCWYAQPTVPAAAASQSDRVVMPALPALQNPESAAVETEPRSAAALSVLESAQAYFAPHTSLIAVLWCLGFALCLLRLLGDIGQVHYLKTQRNFPADEYWLDLMNELLRKAGLHKTVALVESTLVRTPLVVGHLKPFIMFPIGLINRLDPFEAEAIIAHEIAHIVRRDYLFNILQSLVETIFYYHPAVWWLSSAMRREREIAADELAISLTGNPVNYAKALVVVQELAYFPLSPALAFAGPRKSQLFTRIQRILHSKHSKSFVMEKFISASAFLLLLAGLSLAQHYGPNSAPTSSVSITEVSAPRFTPADSTAGIWEGAVENGQLCLTMTRRDRRNHWSTSDCYALSDFSALPKGKGTFTMTREAGTVTFTGEFDGKGGYGRFLFVENPAFGKMLAEQGIKNVDEDLMIHFCMSNVTRGYIDFLKKKGFKNIDGDELAGLAIHGLDQATVTSYLDMFAKMGRKNPGLDDLMSFKIHDVSEEYIAQLNAAGFKDLSLDDVLAAKIHDVTPEFVRSCREMGYPELDFDDVLSFKVHGMSPEYLSGLKNAGIRDLSADEAQGFKVHDITPEYIAGLKAAGFTDLDADQIQGFKIHDVTPEYVASLRAAGLSDLDADNILGFKIHDITPELVAAYRSMGFKSLDNDEIMGLKIHEIDAKYLESCKSLFSQPLGVDEVLSLKIHHIDAAFVEAYKPVFSKKLDMDEVLSLKIHDVTPEFIRRAREKGFKDMTPDEYVQLKIQFGNKLK